MVLDLRPMRWSVAALGLGRPDVRTRLGQAAELANRPHFDGASTRHWNLGGDGDRLVEIRGLDQEEPAQLLACLRKRTVGHQPLAVADTDTGGRGRRLERGGRE